MRPSRLFALASVTLLSRAKRQANETHGWVSTWATAIRDSQGDDLPPPPFGGAQLGVQLEDATVRQTFRTSLGTDRFRIQLSNLFSDTDLLISEANIALPVGGAAGSPDVDLSTVRSLTFGSKSWVTIPAGESVFTDPLEYTLEPLSNIALSIYTENGQVGSVLTGHPGSRTSSWFAHGNRVNEESVSEASIARWFFAGAIEAWLPKTTSSLVALGDSITDGRGSIDNENNKWTDLLAEVLQANGFNNVTVNNQGIGGNSVVSGGLGLPLIQRYQADALAQTGVTHVMIFEGVNDIGNSAPDAASQEQLFSDLTSAYTQIVEDCKAQGLVTIGATITPFGGNSYYAPERDATRQRANQWIMTSGVFDYSVDFSGTLSDGDTLRAEYDSGDFLHPNVAGYQRLAESFPSEIFF